MKRIKVVLWDLWACCICLAQAPQITPQMEGRAVHEGQVTVVYLAPRFATAIWMPDAINSVVLGDPDAFSAEHSEREPRIVIVKRITVKATQTNLLITTLQGYQASVLLISQGEPAVGTKPDIDFMMRYRPVGKFIIDPSYPSAIVARTASLDGTLEPEKARGQAPSRSIAAAPASSAGAPEVLVSHKASEPRPSEPGLAARV